MAKGLQTAHQWRKKLILAPNLKDKPICSRNEGGLGDKDLAETRLSEKNGSSVIKW